MAKMTEAQFAVNPLRMHFLTPVSFGKNTWGSEKDTGWGRTKDGGLRAGEGWPQYLGSSGSYCKATSLHRL